MGVITKISLSEVNELFPTYNFIELLPTSSGIIDTTYIVKNDKKSYILKKYERNISNQVKEDTKLLNYLHQKGLNVPLCIDFQNEWYIYSKLKGSQPKTIRSKHIQLLGRFIAKLHKTILPLKCSSKNNNKNEILESLRYTKNHYFHYYKRYEFLKFIPFKNELLIHGDIFKDNTTFSQNKIGVFDFIDSSCGTLIFDVAIALIGFDVKRTNNYLLNTFLISYNQHAPKKLQKYEVKEQMKIASHYYSLKRLNKYKNTKRAKELI